MAHAVGNSPVVRGLRGGRAGQHLGNLPHGGAAQGPHAADRSRRGVVQSGDDRGAGLPAAEPRFRGLPPLAAPPRWARDPARGNRRRGAGQQTGATAKGPESDANVPPEGSLCIPADAVSRCGGGVRFVWPGTRRRGCPHRGSELAPLRRDQAGFPAPEAVGSVF